MFRTIISRCAQLQKHASTLKTGFITRSAEFSASRHVNAPFLRSLSTDASAGATEGSATSGSTSKRPMPNVVVPPPAYLRHRNQRVEMPYPRGQAWGQSLVTNEELPQPQGVWQSISRRTGVLAIKLGMMQCYDAHGERRAMTVVQVDDCQVLDVNPKLTKRGFVTMQLGAKNRKEKNVPKPLLGHFHRARVAPKQHIASFQVTPDAILPIGWKLDARHFKVGQYVDVRGITTGKGFQGAMKRHGFGGLRASHGVSISHRSHGSTGQRQDPGHVFKNKRMAGHMGCNTITVQNLRIFRIDPERNLIWLMGAVPGFAGNAIEIRDAVKRPFPSAQDAPPFPTFVAPALDKKEIQEVAKEQLGEDPFVSGRVI